MIKRVKVEVDGMSCSHCIVHVQNLFEEVHGVIDVKRIKLGRATLTVSPEFSNESLIKRFEDDGTYKIISVK